MHVDNCGRRNILNISNRLPRPFRDLRRLLVGTIAQENLWLAMDWLNVLLLISMLIAVTGGVPAKQKPQDEDCPQCHGSKKSARDLTAAKGLKRKYCGIKDGQQLFQGSKRSKRYVLRGLQWSKKSVTWRLLNFTPRLNPVYTLETIRKAFKQWDMNSGLTIKEVFDGDADILISFEPKKHYIFEDVYCNMDFDGPGGTIGHAFYPLKNAGYAGNIHMDGDEEFSSDGSFGFNFESAIMHEIGHSLGLMHSSVDGAIMNPNYAMGAKGRNIELHIDDIQGIQELYGPPFAKEDTANAVEENSVDAPEQKHHETSIEATKEPMRVTPPKFENSIVEDSTNDIFDKQNEEENNYIASNEIEIPVKTEPRTQTKAIRTTVRETTKEDRPMTTPSVVQKQAPAESTSGGNTSASDRDISLQSSGLNRPKCPGSFDALYVSSLNSNTYVFNKFFEYSLGPWVGYDGSSHNIRRKFLFPNVDAIYRRTSDNKLIMFSNQLYAVYRDDVILERYGAIYDFGFPYEIKKIDAALIFGPYKNTYFFVGDEYWRFNETYGSMDPGYPKKISSVWRGVPSNVDAAITWKNGFTYFFKGPEYYRIRTRTASVEYGYPKSINVWTKCEQYRNKVTES